MAKRCKRKCKEYDETYKCHREEGHEGSCEAPYGDDNVIIWFQDRRNLKAVSGVSWIESTKYRSWQDERDS